MNINVRPCCLWFWLSLIVSVDLEANEIPGLEPEENWDLSGYVTYRVNSYLLTDQSDYSEQSVQQRFNFEYRYTPELIINASMRNRLLNSHSVNNPEYVKWVSEDSGYVDMSSNVLENDSVLFNSQIDRLSLSLNPEDWMMKIGRFRVNWGMTTIWNPNDIFNTYSIYDTDYAERPGSDGFLIGKCFDFASGAEFVFSPATSVENNRYATRYYFNYNQLDFQFIAGRAEQDNLLGLGFSGAIGGAGFSGETTVLDPTSDIKNGLDTERRVISSLEVNYSIPSKRNWLVRSGVLHLSNTKGQENTYDYLSQSMSVETLSFTRFTEYAEVSFDLTSLNRSTVSGVYYQDDSVYLSYTNQYSVSDNLLLTLSLQRFDGSQSSIFGKAPITLIYMMIRWDW